ncbi:LemA family protein [Bacillaceae bacterium SIJ1]|uniref:LemA family protein n=1 Tax=Litoribacterium kuwaitense TaxID=1398745 RepID=UPI0013EB8FC8|nr:LemA family protein [Litoribacterium kuwaitense]NGP45904.1 LemA family protein [Litoribacterium kuwaitense]
MSEFQVILFVIAIVLFGITLFFIAHYNTLLRLRMSMQRSQTDIETLLRQRHDMIVDLQTFRPAIDQQTWEEVMTLRQQLIKGSTQERIHANDTIKGLLYPILPRLDETENVSLLEDLNDLEQRIMYSANVYNESVQRYNDKISNSPAVAIARLLRLKTRPSLKRVKLKRPK